MAVSREEIIQSFRTHLDRAPTDQEVADHLAAPHADVAGLDRSIFNLDEWRMRDLIRRGVITPPPAQPAAAGPDIATEQLAVQRRNAFDRIKGILSAYGLGELADWAWNQITQDRAEAGVLLDLQEQPAFKQRFAAIEQRKKAGLPAISPAEVIEFENQARSLMRAAGLPQGFYDSPEDFTRFLVNDVSVAELSERVSLAQQAAVNSPPEVREALNRFGVSPGEITAFFLDEQRALPLVQKRFAAAHTAGAANRAGFGDLSLTEAEGLVERGLDNPADAFGALVRSRELFTSINRGEQDIDRGTQLSAISGDVRAQETIERRRGERVAAFQSGGSFSTNREGFGGL